MLAQSGEQARLDQRGLATPRGTVDEADTECLVRIGLFDTILPEADAVGQAVPVPRPRQQFQEKVSILGIEGSQPFGHDLDRRTVGGGDSSGLAAFNSCRSARLLNGTLWQQSEKMPQIVGKI